MRSSCFLSNSSGDVETHNADSDLIHDLGEHNEVWEEKKV